MKPKIERHDLHGTGAENREVYYVGGKDWSSVTGIPCPVQGCDQTLVWYEAGYVPGYRVCMKSLGEHMYDMKSIKHSFLARFVDGEACLIRDDDEEET